MEVEIKNKKLHQAQVRYSHLCFFYFKFTGVLLSVERLENQVQTPDRFITNQDPKCFYTELH